DLTITEAALGATVTVPTLDGETELEFSEGTQAGELRMLRGRGMPVLQGFGRGDQRVLVNVAVPRRLNDEQRKLLEDFARTTDEDSITIDPGRAFGTGSHPTTRLCLELLSELEPASLLDVGCGSGVLAIAAAKLGFAPVVGVDSDPHAIVAAGANAAANGIGLDLRRLDARVDPLPESDVGVANINEKLVGAVGPRLECTLLVTS